MRNSKMLSAEVLRYTRLTLSHLNLLSDLMSDLRLNVSSTENLRLSTTTLREPSTPQITAFAREASLRLWDGQFPEPLIFKPNGSHCVQASTIGTDAQSLTSKRLELYITDLGIVAYTLIDLMRSSLRLSHGFLNQQLGWCVLEEISLPRSILISTPAREVSFSKSTTHWSDKQGRLALLRSWETFTDCYIPSSYHTQTLFAFLGVSPSLSGAGEKL